MFNSKPLTLLHQQLNCNHRTDCKCALSASCMDFRSLILYGCKSQIGFNTQSRELELLCFKMTCSELIIIKEIWKEGARKYFNLTIHSTHCIYGYMASDKW